MNEMSHIKKTVKNITKIIKKSSKKEIFNDTIKEKNWTRNCPICENIIFYTFLSGYCRANTNNRKCRSCSTKITNRRRWGTPKSLQVMCPKCKNKRIFKNREGARTAEKTKSCCMKCSNILSKNNKQKSAKTRTKSGNALITPNYNRTACKIFDEINQNMKWNGVHGENGGELQVDCWFLDYYEPKHNIAIEYDEKYHTRKKQKQRDWLKETQIKQQLKCKFYRIKEGQNWREVIK